MVGGFGILLILLAIIRHIGACVKDEMRDARGKASDAGIEMGYYYGASGTKLRNNNHSCHENRDPIKGRYVVDHVTHQTLYPEIEAGILEMRKLKAEGKKVGTTFKWKPKTCGQTVYIDWNTEEIYYLACFTKRGVMPIWFYTDFATREKVIRKSDRQIAYEKKENKTSDLSIINPKDDWKHSPKPFCAGEYIYEIFADERFSRFDEILGGEELKIG